MTVFNSTLSLKKKKKEEEEGKKKEEGQKIGRE